MTERTDAREELKTVALPEVAAEPLALPRVLDYEAERAKLPTSNARRATVLFIVLGAGLVVATLVAAALGQMQIPVVEVIGSLCRRAGLSCGAAASHVNTDAVLWEVRFPRVVLAVLVGAALASAGAIMQGVFGNPLADPGVVGVSSGAAIGASLMIVTGLAAGSTFAIPLGAFVTGVTTALVVYSISRSRGKTQVITLILVGVAVNAFAGAALALMTFSATTNQREQIVFWQMGSLAGALWDSVATVLPLLAVGLVLAFTVAGKLDLLSLGDDAARHLGLNIERLRVFAIIIVAVLTATAVAFAGIIGFVGLVVPHIIRMVMGPGHRVLVPASALGGALLLVVADTFARTALPYAELPLGMITALVGGPFFFYLIKSSSASRNGGW
ncbi:FecCD family ABC transporter permease [Leucobacter chromiireducens]|uniref:Iron ABC transporter permease n=1 Tax=Leucobacter chromiireducens subsp. solipictus TaxID=398235 RepID=A0ABS1SJU6_9MICO|nr:iron ABC transporter permease [Leucobacter chromiireducens]MBL3679769.1 iron ABC transporter permease [Leucobacter chromiireducens subsp. solipictus]